MEIRSTLRLFETEKLAVFSKPKVATRLLDSINFDKSYTGGIDINWDGNPVESSMFDISTTQNTKREYSLFSKNKNKKDIILLYRDPMERFLSGLVESTIIYSLSSPLQLSYALPTINKFKSNLSSLVYGCNCIINSKKILPEKSFNSNNLYDESVELLNILVSNVTLMLSQINIPYNVHTDNYLMIYNSLIRNKFDLNKVTLINIDDSKNNLLSILEKYLQLYKTGMGDNTHYSGRPKIEASHSNSILKKMVKNELRNNNDLENKIKNYIQVDEYFYHEFENSPLNILNKK